MNKIIGVTDLQRKFKKVFDEVAEEHIPYVLTRGSRPEAVLVPYEQYLNYVKIDESGVLKRFDELLAKMAAASAGSSFREVENDVQEARKSLRGPKRR
jgi:prevent-host-death family protein